MKKYFRIILAIFAIPWIIFGIQHFMYAGFVTGLVPAFMPFRAFWVYFTGTAMIAAGISFIVYKFPSLAAGCLGLMLTIFVLLVHGSNIFSKPMTADTWTRPVQDIALAAIAFIAANILADGKNEFLDTLAKFSRYILALCVIFFGIDQFLNLDFLTAKIPTYMPLRILWVYAAGIAMIAAGVFMLINKRAEQAAIWLGSLLILINILQYGYVLANDLYNPINWTALMLNWAITSGLFILASSCKKESGES